MNHTLLFSAALLLSISMTSYSQQRPAELVPQLGDPSGPGVVSYIDKLTPEQRIFYWKGKTKKDDYFLVDVPSEYLAIIGVDLDMVNSKHNKGVSSINNYPPKNHLGLSFLGRFSESKNRVSDFYKDAESRLVMIITWNFIADGAGKTIVTEFLNARVNNYRANLSLAKSEGKRNVLWKLTWINDKTSFEVFVEDSLALNGQPLKNAKTIIALGEDLTSY